MDRHPWNGLKGKDGPSPRKARLSEVILLPVPPPKPGMPLWLFCPLPKERSPFLETGTVSYLPAFRLQDKLILGGRKNYFWKLVISRQNLNNENTFRKSPWVFKHKCTAVAFPALVNYCAVFFLFPNVEELFPPTPQEPFYKHGATITTISGMWHRMLTGRVTSHFIYKSSDRVGRYI